MRRCRQRRFGRARRCSSRSRRASTQTELGELRAASSDSGQPLVVGFNRRHAPLARALRDHVRRGADCRSSCSTASTPEPLPEDHWLNDLEDGGGRLLGEGCHFVDFACWIAGALPERVSCVAAPEPRPAPGRRPAFQRHARVRRSLAGHDLLRNRDRRRRARSTSRPTPATARRFWTTSARSPPSSGAAARRRRTRAQDKGHAAQFAGLPARLATGAEPDQVSHLDTMEATLAALESALGRS